MNIRYLGTAAAEGIPAIFCNCKTCTEARKRGGKNIRTRSQALIDDKILIDFNADTYMHTLNNGIDLANIRYCLITHTHEDHLYINEIYNRFPGYSDVGRTKPLRFYGSEGTAKLINGYINSISMNIEGIVESKDLKLFEPVIIGENYRVTALPAIHDACSFPVIYIIENSEGKSMLYAHDTNFFSNDVWEYLADSKIKFNFVSLDCTEANTPKMNYIGHMNLNSNIRTKDRLKEIMCADENTVFCLNHFSHNGIDVLYEEFSEIVKKYGFLTSYDGMSNDF